MYILITGNCTDDVYSYICKCEAGWTGKRCEVEIDECESSPCVNGNWSFLLPTFLPQFVRNKFFVVNFVEYECPGVLSCVGLFVRNKNIT